MIGLADLLEEVEYRIDNQQDGSKHIRDGVVFIVKGPGNMDDGDSQEGKGADQHHHPENLVFDQPVDKITEQAIFDDREKVEVEIGRDVPDIVVVAVKQFSDNVIA